MWLVSFREDGSNTLQTEEVRAEDQRDAEKQFETAHRNKPGYTIFDVKRAPWADGGADSAPADLAAGWEL
jgi:hypothetical protein